MQDAKRGGARGGGAFERKELTLAVVPADARGRPAGAPLGTVVLNLADYASAEGRPMQQAFTVVPAGGRNLGGAKLLLTIRCAPVNALHCGVGQWVLPHVLLLTRSSPPCLLPMPIMPGTSSRPC